MPWFQVVHVWPARVDLLGKTLHVCCIIYEVELILYPLYKLARQRLLPPQNPAEVKGCVQRCQCFFIYFFLLSDESLAVRGGSYVDEMDSAIYNV